jgi:hypothetical protein
MGAALAPFSALWCWGGHLSLGRINKGNAIDAIEVKWEKSAIPKNFKTIRKHYPEIDTRLLVKSDFLEPDNPVGFLSPRL